MGSFLLSKNEMSGKMSSKRDVRYTDSFYTSKDLLYVYLHATVPVGASTISVRINPINKRYGIIYLIHRLLN